MSSRRAPAAQSTTAPGPPACEELNMLYLIGRVDRVVRREIDRVVKAHGLSAAQYTTLSVLARRSGLSNAQLARRALVSSQSMNEVLLALEADGLIIRSPAAHHGRVVETVLSQRGHEVLAACDRAVGHMENAMLADLGEAEREQLFQALTSCVYRLGSH
jgi:DNA-binding MarR family transcriptional regulator